MAEGLEGEPRVGQGAVSDRTVDEPGARRRLAQGERGYRLARHQRPGVVERRQIDHVVIEGVGDPAVLVAPLQELHIHAHVLTGGDDGLSLRQQRGELGQGPAQRDPVLFPFLGVVAEELGGLGGDAIGACRSPSTHAGPALHQPVVGDDHADLGDVVELGIETAELAVQEGESEFGQIPRGSVRLRGAPNGSRTRVSALRGPRPRPLDDGSEANEPNRCPLRLSILRLGSGCGREVGRITTPLQLR